VRFEQVRVTVLVDNDTSRPDLRGEHGFALWIEAGESKVLFDTGASGLVCENAAKLGIDLSEADAVVLSHGHDDHAGGLSAVADKAPRSVLYAHPTAGAGQRGLSVVNSSHPETVAPGLRTTGEIRRITGFEPPDLTYFPDDQALFFEVEAKGLVVVVGCAHAGVVNTVKQVARLAARKRVHAVLGGMHLHDASEERLAGTIQAFRDYGLRRIGPFLPPVALLLPPVCRRSCS